MPNQPENLFFENQISYKWFSTKEAASYLALTPNALRIMVHRGTVPAYKLGGRLRFRLIDLSKTLQPKES
jgi:excisionase family DNA binding protein